MKVKCEYCNNFIPDTEEICPVCGAPNEHMVRSGSGIPKTIEELKAYALSKNLPLEKMRFFIGEDIREARAFGIYKDEAEDFVVYKNKSDGERVVRYRGSDEAYAVNELYQKMRAEVTDRKANMAENGGKPEKKKKGGAGKVVIIVAAIFIACVAGIFGMAFKMPDSGYYLYRDTYYFTQDMGESWYEYEELNDDWFAIHSVDKELYKNWKKYKIAGAETKEADIDDSIYYPDFYEDDDWDEYDTDRYDDEDTNDDNDTWDDDWDDDDLDWDSDDNWDSGDSDWDSDW